MHKSKHIIFPLLPSLFFTHIIVFMQRFSLFIIEEARRVLWVFHISPGPGTMGSLWGDRRWHSRVLIMLLTAPWLSTESPESGDILWPGDISSWSLPCPDDDIPDSLSPVTMTMRTWSMSSARSHHWRSVCPVTYQEGGFFLDHHHDDILVL